MLGSLTVLPAVLSKLGDRVEKGRIPFLHRLRRTDNGDGIWSPILNPVLRHPVVATIASSAVLLALAVPALSLHTAQTGMDGISTPVVEPFVARDGRLPGHARAGHRRDQGRRRKPAWCSSSVSRRSRRSAARTSR